MNNNLLAPVQYGISDTQTLKICALDKKCSSIYLEVRESDRQGRKETVYSQTIQSCDFTQGESNSQSILFIKLALQCCFSRMQQDRKNAIQVQKVSNLIWEKVVVGKDKIDAALSSMKKQRQNKKYNGMILKLSYPEHILLILPKISNPQEIPNMKQLNITQSKKQTEQTKVKKMFYATMDES